MATTITAGNATNGAAISSDNTGILELKTGTGSGTTAMTVGTGQNVTFAQTANLPNTFGFKNRIINGAMVIDQRNNGASVTLNNSAFLYTVDRWACLTGTASSSTVTAQRVTGASGFSNALRILRGSGTYTGIAIAIQEIETLNCQDLAGQTVSISFWLRKGSAFSASSVYVQGITGSGTDQGISGAHNGTWTNFLAPVLTNITSASISTSFTQFTTTLNVPAGTNEIALYFVVNSFSGTGSANDFVDITGVQLEKGSTATSFDYRPYGTELALCQRYYWKITTFPLNVAATTQFCGSNIKFPVTMRAAPTLSNATFTMGTGNAGTATTLGTTVEGCGIYNSANNWTVGALCQVSCDFTGAEL